MHEPLVSFRLVEAAARRAAPAPAFLFGPLRAAQSRAIYGQIETPELGCYTIADAAVAPTGIALRDGTAFAGETLNLPPEHVVRVITRLNEFPPPARFVAGPLMPLFGPAEESWPHAVLDYLPRLWVAEAAGHALASLRLLIPAVLTPEMEALVGLLGIDAARIERYAHWDEIIRTDLLVLPTIARRHTRLSPSFGAATRFWAGRFPAAAPAPSARLFVLDEEDACAARLAGIAQARGYRVAHRAGLTLAERAKLFAGATHIVGLDGAALHDSVFAVPDAVVCAVRDADDDRGFLQTGLCASMGQRVGYVFALDGDRGLEAADFNRALDVMEV